MDFGNILGWIAAILTLVITTPFAIAQWRVKGQLGISVRNLVLILVATLLWIIYGVQNSSPALVISAIVIFVVYGVLLLIRLRSPQASQ